MLAQKEAEEEPGSIALIKLYGIKHRHSSPHRPSNFIQNIYTRFFRRDRQNRSSGIIYTVASSLEVLEEDP